MPMKEQQSKNFQVLQLYQQVWCSCPFNVESNLIECKNWVNFMGFQIECLYVSRSASVNCFPIIDCKWNERSIPNSKYHTKLDTSVLLFI